MEVQVGMHDDPVNHRFRRHHRKVHLSVEGPVEGVPLLEGGVAGAVDTPAEEVLGNIASGEEQWAVLYSGFQPVPHTYLQVVHVLPAGVRHVDVVKALVVGEEAEKEVSVVNPDGSPDLPVPP